MNNLPSSIAEPRTRGTDGKGVTQSSAGPSYHRVWAGLCPASVCLFCTQCFTCVSPSYIHGGGPVGKAVLCLAGNCSMQSSGAGKLHPLPDAYPTVQKGAGSS